MKRRSIGLLLSGLVLVSVVGAAQAFYPVYYDASYPAGGVESGTRLYIANPHDTAVRYTVTVYSPSGTELGSREGIVNDGNAHHIWLADLISGDRTRAWGLCTVQTWLNYPEDLVVVAERYVASTLTGYDPSPKGATATRHEFFYTAQYTSGGPNNDTHLAILNPTNTANHYAIELYDVYGALIGLEYGVVNPKTTAVHRASEMISGARDFAWGLCVVRAQTYAYEEVAVSVFRMRNGQVLDTQTAP
ncbi:MAG: hypothetical protein AB1778_10330 [Candidatus Bipolaricaulota bacterium]